MAGLYICENRSRISTSHISAEPRHNFHWVAGLIADDKVFDVIDEYMNGEISDDEAIRRTRTLHGTYQLSLHTQAFYDILTKKSIL